MTTHIHNLTKSLQSSTGAFARLTQSFEKRRDRLINGFGANMFLKSVEGSGSCRAYIRLVVDQRSADHRDDLLFMIFSLSFCRVFPGNMMGGQRWRIASKLHTHIISQSAKQTPSLVWESVEVIFVLKFAMISPTILSPNLRQSSAIVLAAIYVEALVQE